MNVKEAVVIAKSYLSDLLADENMQNLGLEEVEFNEGEDAWMITLGFSRPWNRILPSSSVMSVVYDKKGEQRPRDYRVITVGNSDGRVRSVKLHEIAA